MAASFVLLIVLSTVEKKCKIRPGLTCIAYILGSTSRAVGLLQAVAIASLSLILRTAALTGSLPVVSEMRFSTCRENVKKIRLRHAQDARVQVAPSKLSMLIK